MALPTTISGVRVAVRTGRHGPFISSGGNVYVIVRDSVEIFSVEAYKATDPTSSFTEQDGANRPSHATAASIIDVFQVNDKLHCVYTSNTKTNPVYSAFDMATDTWVDIDGLGDRDVVIADEGGHGDDTCAIVVLSSGKIRVVASGATDKNMGTDWHRVDERHSTDGGQTWSAPVQVFGAASDLVHYDAPVVVLGDSDTVHIIGHDGTNLLQRALSSADALQTERDTGFDIAAIIHPLNYGVSFDRGGTTKIRVPYKDSANDLHCLRFDAAADPSTFNSDSISADEPQVANDWPIACLAVDGSTVHALFVKVADDDLYSADDGDADTWTTPASTFTGTVNHVSANVYDRSGTKLAHLIDDGGTVKYDEDELAAASTTVDMALASFTLSGHDPSVTKQTSLNMDAANLSLTGQAADITLDVNIPIDAGNVTLNGHDPAVTRDLLIAQDTGGFTLNGQDPDLLRSLLVEMAQGAVTFDGLDPDLTLQIHVPMALAQFTLDGQSNTITRDLFIAMNAGEAILVGQDPDLLRSLLISMAISPPMLLRPDAVDTQGGWTTDAGGSDLHSVIDEANPDDGDYIQSGSAPANDRCKVSIGDPGSLVDSTAAHVLRYRYRKSAAGAQIDLTVRLVEGASTVIASWSHTDIPDSIAQADQTLSGAEIGAISNYDNLFLEFEANQP